MILYYLILLFSAVPNQTWVGSDVAGITFIKVTGAVCAVYAIFCLTTRKSPAGFLTTWPARLFIALFLIALSSYLFKDVAGDIRTTAISIYLSILSLFFITLSVIDSRARLRLSLFSLMGGIGLASLYTVREWQAAGFSYYRPGYVAGDSNFFAAAALLTLPVTYYLTREKASPLARVFCWGCLAITTLGFVCASSRGGLIGLCLSVIYMLIRSERRLNLLLIATVALIVMLSAPISPIHRLLHPDESDKASAEIHKGLWAAGLDMIRENPFWGIGLGNFRPQIAELRALRDSSGTDPGAYMAHNSYLEYAAELGIPALVIFLGILGSTFFLLERVRKNAVKGDDTFLKQVALGLQAGLIGFAGSAFFFSAEYEKPFWLVVFISCSIPAVLLAEKSYVATAPEIQKAEPEPSFAFGAANRANGFSIGQSPEPQFGSTIVRSK
jgi:O-antigen ligase